MNRHVLKIMLGVRENKVTFRLEIREALRIKERGSTLKR
jgi:hypothetical protein